MNYLGWNSNTQGNLFYLGWLSETVSIEIENAPTGGFFREAPIKLDDDKVIMAVINKFLQMVNKDD